MASWERRVDELMQAREDAKEVSENWMQARAEERMTEELELEFAQVMHALVVAQRKYKKAEKRLREKQNGS